MSDPPHSLPRQEVLEYYTVHAFYWQCPPSSRGNPAHGRSLKISALMIAFSYKGSFGGIYAVIAFKGP